MTTVGYGDMFPQTTIGQILGSLTMLSGITILAIVVNVLGASFENARERQIKIDEWDQMVEEMRRESTQPRNSSSPRYDSVKSITPTAQQAATDKPVSGTAKAEINSSNSNVMVMGNYYNVTVKEDRMSPRMEYRNEKEVTAI